jgi:hypothetical protein
MEDEHPHRHRRLASTRAELVIWGPCSRDTERARHSASGAESGVPVETDIWYVWTVREGKTVRADIFTTGEKPSKPPA